MSEIPEDIMKIADNLAACSVGEGIGREILSGNIARVILAEREACTKIAQDRIAAYRDLMDKTKGDQELTRTRFDVYEHSYEAVKIVAGRIRRR